MMWTRKELKEKAKQAFRLNYWKTVLVALIVTMIAGGAGAGGGAGASSAASSGAAGALSGYESSYEETGDYDFEDTDDYDAGYDFDESGIDADINEDIFNEYDYEPASSIPPVAIFMFVLAIMALVAVIVAIAILADIFLLNPLQIGSSRFFLRNLSEPAEVKEVAYGYDHSYKNVVKVLFFKDLYTFLWSLLFIIPGIVKSYEYRMIPYLLAEHPEMSKEEAFARSKQMMTGQKWKTFVLDLSFILWDLLSLCTLGILSILYVEPYKCMTNAALYEVLAGKGTTQTAPVQDIPRIEGEIVNGQNFNS